MKCKRCLLDSDICTVKDGICEFCRLHDKLKADYHPAKWEGVLKKIRKHRCLIGISGGFDSALLLDWAQSWGLDLLVIHFDNGYNTPEAENNMRQLTKNVEFIRYQVNGEQYRRCNDAFVRAGLPDADIPNDMIMTSLMYRAAKQYRIKYILNGHNFRTEGSTPVKWTYMDARYIKSVYSKFYDDKFTLPVFTFGEQIRYALSGVRQVRPFYYHDFDIGKEKKRLIKKYGLKDYGGKHGENIYTDFIGSWYLPEVHGIDKRIIYLSARIRNGDMTKTEALRELQKRHLTDDVHALIPYYNSLEKMTCVREDFDRYDFKKYRILIYLMTKMGVLPYTFYKKYCK